MTRMHLLGALLVIIGMAGTATANRSMGNEILSWTPHPTYGQQRFLGCPAMAETGIDNGLANAIVSARGPATRAGDVANGIVGSIAPGHDAETRAVSERMHFMPLSNIVCGANRQGRKIRFERGMLGGDVTSMSVSGPRGSVSIDIKAMGNGLDGERVVALTMSDGSGELDDLVADSLPLCLTTAASESEAMTAVVDSFGGVLGAVLGQRSTENEVFRSTCRMLARKLG